MSGWTKAHVFVTRVFLASVVNPWRWRHILLKKIFRIYFYFCFDIILTPHSKFSTNFVVLIHSRRLPKLEPFLFWACRIFLTLFGLLTSFDNMSQLFFVIPNLSSTCTYRTTSRSGFFFGSGCFLTHGFLIVAFSNLVTRSSRIS